jgi:hypothetical protein
VSAHSIIAAPERRGQRAPWSGCSPSSAVLVFAIAAATVGREALGSSATSRRPIFDLTRPWRRPTPAVQARPRRTTTWALSPLRRPPADSGVLAPRRDIASGGDRAVVLADDGP